MKKNWVRLSILGVIVFIVTFLVRFPADKLANLIQENSHAGIHWQSVSGTVLDAHVQGLVVNLQDNRALYIENIDLEVSLPTLLTGRINTQIHAYNQAGYVNGMLVLGLNSWSLRDLSGDIDLMHLQSAIPELGLLQAGGMLKLSVPLLSGDYHALPHSGSMVFTINGLQLGVIIDGQELGSYMLSASVNGEDGFRGILETIPEESQLFIEGNGFYTPKPADII